MLVNTLSACTCTRICAVSSLALRGGGGGFQLDCASLCRALAAGAGGYFEQRKDRGVVLCFLYFAWEFAYVSVCECDCAYTHTHTRTACEVLGCEPSLRVI